MCTLEWCRMVEREEENKIGRKERRNRGECSDKSAKYETRAEMKRTCAEGTGR